MPKKLNQNSIRACIQQLKIEDVLKIPQHSDYDNYLYPFLLINNRYLLSILNKNTKFSISTTNYEFTLYLPQEKGDFLWPVFLNLSTSALIKLAKIENIRISINVSNSQMDRENVRKWTEMCLELKKNIHLKQIDVEVFYTHELHSRIFFDLLHNKINKIELECSDDCKMIYFGSKFQLEQLKISSTILDVVNLMRIKAQKIIFNEPYSCDQLINFSKHGKLNSNPHIKTLKTDIKFDYLNDNIEFSNAYGFKMWKNITLEHYNKSIQCLKDVNPKMELEISNYKNPNKSTFKNTENASGYLKILIEKIALFIDMVKGQGLEISYINFEDSVYVSQRIKEFVLEMNKKIKLEWSGNSIKDSFCYKGVEVSISIEIKRDMIEFYLDVYRDEVQRQIERHVQEQIGPIIQEVVDENLEERINRLRVAANEQIIGEEQDLQIIEQFNEEMHDRISQLMS